MFTVTIRIYFNMDEVHFITIAMVQVLDGLKRWPTGSAGTQQRRRKQHNCRFTVGNSLFNREQMHVVCRFRRTNLGCFLHSAGS